jgi:ABC-2 type transport system ATP-binding protein
MAVDNINLNIKKGEFFGLLGPNGAGKTTLIKMLCCLILPNAGTARIFDHDIVREEATVKKLVGLVSSEERSFYWRLTGFENLEFYGSLYHLPRQQVKGRIGELLNLVGLANEGDIRFQNYSTGMRQKLAIARGLLSNPEVLFVDEPTRSLDPVSAQAVRSIFKKKVSGEGKTVILATHNLSEAEQLCDRLAIMDHGRIIALGSVKELRSFFQKYTKCELSLKNIREDLLPQLSSIDGVLNCDLANQQDGISNIEITISDRDTVLPSLLRSIVYSGAEIHDCKLIEQPLEEIFVHALDNINTEENN